MGLFDDHVGVWCGTHLVIDSQGREIDRFEATVTSRREGDRWFQTTTRAWPDGRATESEFTGTFDAAGVLHFEGPHVKGRGIALGDGNIVSTWKDPSYPDTSYCSINTLLKPDRRVRTVQKIERGRLAARTLVKEARVRKSSRSRKS